MENLSIVDVALNTCVYNLQGRFETFDLNNFKSTYWLIVILIAS